MAPDVPAGEAFSAVIVGAAAMRGDAERAVALARGRIMARLDWDDVATLGDRAGRPVLVIEAEGVAPDTLAPALARIDAVAVEDDLQVVVAFGPDEIDLVAATLLRPQVQLLCAPTLIQRVGALAVAGNTAADTLHDGIVGGEAERLQRLNEEVARIAEVLAKLSGHDLGRGRDEDLADRRIGYAAGGGGERGADPQAVRNAIRSRRMRDAFFAAGLFEDPGWDMLLDLFAAELEGGHVSVSSLCIAAAVAPTTALRWIGKMTETGLFERRADPIDRRRAFIGLTTKASTGMHGYVDAVRRAGLGIA